MRTSHVLVSLAACCALWLSSSPAIAADNFIGSWKLDVAKSEFKPGPTPESQSLKLEAVEGGIKVTSRTVDAAGMTMEDTYVSKFDGTDVSWKGNTEADTASSTRVDDNSYQNVWKKRGKATMKAKVVVSADGTTLTMVQSGRDNKGAPIEIIGVYSRE